MPNPYAVCKFIYTRRARQAALLIDLCREVRDLAREPAGGMGYAIRRPPAGWAVIACLTVAVVGVCGGRRAGSVAPFGDVVQHAGMLVEGFRASRFRSGVGVGLDAGHLCCGDAGTT